MASAPSTRDGSINATNANAPTSSGFVLVNHQCPHQPCGGCAKLAKIDATKVTSQNFLELIHRRYSFKSTLNSWHDHLASRLPFEIMSHIFILFDSVNEPRDAESLCMSQSARKHWDHLLRTPALLSRVCKQWRSVVLATPQLWTKYYIDVWTQARGDLGFLSQFLSRSGCLPLSIRMWGDLANDDDEDMKGISMVPLANLIRSYSAPWKFLDISYVPEELTQEMLQGLDYIPLSVLEGLEVNYFYLPEPIHLREPLRLKYLSISYMDDIGTIPLEWDNLTHLEMSYLDMSILLYIVKQVPQLKKWISEEVITFRDLMYGPHYPPPDSPIILPALEHLQVTFKEYHVDGFFSSLTLPALTHLVCHYGLTPEIDAWDLDFDDTVDFLARSELDSKNLQTFDLHYEIFSTNYDRRYIDLAALTHLSVRARNRRNIITDSYLSRLSDISVLPRLRRLALQVPNMPSYSWSLICNVFRGDLLPVGHGPIDPSDYTVITTPTLTQSRWFHKRPLENVSVEVQPSEIIRTIIPRTDYLFLRGIQRAGFVDLMIEDVFHMPKSYHREDILPRMGELYKNSD